MGRILSHSNTAITNRVPDDSRFPPLTRSSSQYSLTASELYDVTRRGQGLLDDGRHALWYVETPVNVDRHLGVEDGVRLHLDVLARRSEAYAVLVHCLYQDQDFQLFLARIDTIFTARSIDNGDYELGFAHNHTPAYANGLVAILVRMAVYNTPYLPESSPLYGDYVLCSEPGKPIHATAFLVASDVLPDCARAVALPFLGRFWSPTLHGSAFPYDGIAGTHTNADDDSIPSSSSGILITQTSRFSTD